SPTPPLRLNPDLPLKLEDIINKALEKDRGLRYQHASDMRPALQRLKRDTDSSRSAIVAAESGAPEMPSRTVSAKTSQSHLSTSISETLPRNKIRLVW